MMARPLRSSPVAGPSSAPLTSWPAGSATAAPSGGGEEDYGGALSHRGRGPQGYRRTDARISEDAHDRLTDDPRVDATNIQVSVKDGEVTLTGTVADRAAKHRAEHCVEDIPGVGHVQNNLRVDPDQARRATPLGENPILDAQARGDE